MAQPCHVIYKHPLPLTIPVTSSRRKRQKGADTDDSLSAKHQSVTRSSPKKSRLGPSPEEHTSPQTAEAGGSSAKEDTKYDMKKLMEGLKRAGTKEEYKLVPAGLHDLIDRLCIEHDVKHAAWTQSADWREVKILGRGATQILKELRESAKSEFQEYRFTAVESGPSHTTKLSLEVVAEHPGRAESEKPTVESATSELILEGRREFFNDAQNAEVYIGCTAHGLLTKEQCDELDQTLDSQQYNHQIRTIPAKLKKSSTKYTLSAQLNNNNKKDFPLSCPSLICYHHFSLNGEACPANRCEGDALPKCPHMYENDIALLPLDGDTVKQLREGLGDKFQPFDDIVHFTRQEINKFIRQKINFHIKDFQGELLPGLTGAGNNRGQVAEHIKFSIRHGGQLEEGDSGSVLYVEYGDKRLAFAMLVSKLRSEDSAENQPSKDSKPEYTAIYLQRALDDIKADYKFGDLKLHKPTAAPVQR